MFDPKEDTPKEPPSSYSGTLPTLVARGNVTAYDVNDGDIITDSVSYPNEAGLRALVKIDYDVTNAGMTTVSALAIDPNLAYKPKPFDKAKNVQPAEFSLISWSAGTNVTQHDVYFGTDKTAVANANTSSDEYIQRQALADTNYAPMLEYVFSRDYFWRVDEVNALGDAQWPGSVWSFTAADHAVVDDFDSYVSNTELYAVWDDYWTNDTGSELFIEVDANIVRDGNSLMFDYDNTVAVKGVQQGSIADTTISRLGISPDWTLSGTKALRLAFRGQAGNAVSADDKMWVQLEDTSSNSGVVLYDGDPNDVTEEEWHEWHVDLADFNSAGVVLTNVDKVHIGFGGVQGGQAKAAGSGTVWFDDIELWAPYCRTELIPTDFTGDCVTDGLDLAMMAADWLESDGLVTAAPPAFDPLLWLMLDDGAGQVADNNGTSDANHDGQLGGTSGADPCDPTWVTTDPCTDRLKNLEFDGVDDHVVIPPLDINTNSATITAWVKRDGVQADWAGIVFCRGPNTVSGSWASTVSGIGFRGGKTNHDLSYHWDDWWWNFESGLTIPDGQWTFTGLVVSPDQATLYMSDGTTYSSKTNVTYHGPDAWDANAFVGADPQTSAGGGFTGRLMKGRIDDVRIYDKSLSAGEVLGLAGLSTTFYDSLETATNLVVRVPDPAVDPNYYPSNPDIINFDDYDVVAEKWLEGPTLWP
jgi:hypothetical protein